MKRISVTDLELYMRCPRAFKLKTIDGVIAENKHLALCKSIVAKRVIFWMYEKNEVLSSIEKLEIEKQCDLFWKEEIADPRIDKEELKEIVICAKPETKRSKAKPSITKEEKFLGDIKSWCVKYKDIENADNVISRNIPYECKIGDMVFTGNIDLIRSNNDQMEIVKLRTSSSPPTQAFIERDISFTLAAYACWKGSFLQEKKIEQFNLPEKQIPRASYCYLPFLDTYKRNSKKGKKDQPKGNPEILKTISERRLIDFEYEILQIAAGIDMSYFPMRVVQPCGCCLCSYRYQCEAFAETKNHNQVVH